MAHYNSSIIPFPQPYKPSLPAPQVVQGLSNLLGKYDKPSPRYTSYPTIDQCGESVGPEALMQALQGRAVGGLQRPLSLYVHLPFCASVCYYCACNKVITKKYDQVERYLHALEKEARWVQQHNAAPTPLIQFHLGGGTPTFLTDEDLTRLVSMLGQVFQMAKHAERSIEVDPRTVNHKRLQHLKQLGFNRLSFGVQDFDPVVQKAVHREQTFESVQALMEQARALGFDSINVDLIYGLPHQTTATFAHTLQQIIALQPDRIAMYGYAHLPERFKPQRRIHSADLPSAATRVDLLALAIEHLQQAGYDYIGMDHFAKPSDTLSKAKRQGVLHRNFQGYTTQPDADLIGLGVSAISKLGSTLVQNTRDLPEYLYAIDTQGCATFRGHVHDRDDVLRQSVIMTLLCQGAVDYDDFKHTHWLEFEAYFARECESLAEFEQEGLLTRSESGFQLTAQGWYFVRSIAMVFDKYARQSRVQRSKVL